MNLILTCEHASNKIPKEYSKLFNKSALNSHRGLDIGADFVYQFLRKKLNCYSQSAEYSRLLIELNRSLDHNNLFSEFSTQLDSKQKQALIKKIYLPYQEKLIQQLKLPCLHIGIHSFTPILNGKKREADLGLLYDPKKPQEKAFCSAWKKWLMQNSDYQVKLNYPYKGSSDGLTTILRKKFPKNYLGLELEINQKLLKNKKSSEKVAELIYTSLQMQIQHIENNFNRN